MSDISDHAKSLRKEYRKSHLNENGCPSDPFELFETWFADAVASEIEEANAMVLATATKSGVPAARVVLLKSFDKHGFVFFTNYKSRKGRELEENPSVALLFFWEALERQVRIEGTASQISREESALYFQSRPKSVQIGAHVSAQSSELASREVLEIRMQELGREYEGKDVPCPHHWGGYRITPTQFEFWQGRENRLHDRVIYGRSSLQEWYKKRLCP